MSTKAIALILSIGMIMIYGCEKIDITKYRGDGKISHSGHWLFYPGYIITFDTIDLSKTFSKSYKIINCPELNKPYDIGFHFQSDEKNVKKSLEGKLRIRLSNKIGSIFDIDADLKEWNVSKATSSKSVDYFIYYLQNNDRTSVTTQVD